MQHYILLEYAEENAHQDKDANDRSDDISEADEVDIGSPANKLDISVEPEHEKNLWLKRLWRIELTKIQMIVFTRMI